MYRVYWNHAVATYSSLYFFIFLSLQFSNIKFFITLFSGTVSPRRLKLGTHVDNGGCIMYTGIILLLLFVPLFFHFSFSTIFKHKKFSSEFSWQLWGLEGWNFIQTWTVGSCIVYSKIRMLLLIQPFSSFFFLSNFQILNIFVTLFAGTVRPRRLKLVTQVNNGCVPESYCCCLFVSLFLHFSSSQIFKH